MNRHSLTFVLALAALAVGSARSSDAANIATGGSGGLILVGEGRSTPTVTVQSNLANTGGSTAFALDALSGFGHNTVELNDGIYGNSNSWIGNGATGTSGPYAGIAFTGSQQINRLTFGRHNFDNTFTDRNLGLYTLQYRNDGSTADNAGWTTIGTINYTGVSNAAPFNTIHRHEFRFNPVNATAVRLLVPATGLPTGTAIDEIEIFGGSAAAPAPVAVSAPGGSYNPVTNLALQTKTAIAFAQDVIPGFPAIHNIPNLNDGLYGNSESWIGNNNPATSSFAGVNLNGVFTIDSIALGRDNGGEATVFTDRSMGAYTFQYTTVANPTAATSDSQWQSIGIGAITAGPATRRVFSFAPIGGVTGVRVITGAGDLAIDELEVTGTGQNTFTLQATGTHNVANVVPDNLALASNGATAFAKDLLGNGSFAPTHTIANVNDGLYGNSDSWIGNSDNSFVGVAFDKLSIIDSVAWGRDSGGEATAFTDRSLGLYTLQYTTVENPDETTPDGDWLTIGMLSYSDLFPTSPSTRHEWGFDAVAATGIRLFVPGNGLGSGAAIDELEVFGTAVPEPASLAFWGLIGAAATVVSVRLRRKQ